MLNNKSRQKATKITLAVHMFDASNISERRCVCHIRLKLLRVLRNQIIEKKKKKEIKMYEKSS